MDSLQYLTPTVYSLVKLSALGVIIAASIWVSNKAVILLQSTTLNFPQLTIQQANAWANSRRKRAQPIEVTSLSEKAPAIEPLHDFDWKTAARQKLRTFKSIYHITMGELSLLLMMDERLNRISYPCRHTIGTHHH